MAITVSCMRCKRFTNAKKTGTIHEKIMVDGKEERGQAVGFVCRVCIRKDYKKQQAIKFSK